MTFVPKGIIPAMVPPLTSDGKVNEKGLRRLIDFLIDGGSHGLFVVGTTGEFYGLSPDYFQGGFKMLRFSANITMLFNEVDFLARFVKQLGSGLNNQQALLLDLTKDSL